MMVSTPEVISSAVTALSQHATQLSAHLAQLSDAQIQVYGRWLMAGVAAYYLAASVQSPLPADVQYAIDAHLPQGYDRSIIAARLEQRHARQIIMQCLQLQELRERMRAETSRDGKIRGWQQVFRRTLAGMLAGAYAHSLTLSLFVMKNTVRVLVFVLYRREEAARAVKEKKRRGGALSKMRAWWAGGTQSVLMETFMDRMNAQMEQQASPFANTGLDEEALPVPPAVDGKDAFVYSQMLARELRQEDDKEERDTAGNGSASSQPMPGGLAGNGADSEGAWSAAAMADADRLFSVKEALNAALPRVVATAKAVVDRVLARHAPGAFAIAGIVTAAEMRTLLAELCEEMERSACVAEWLCCPRAPAANQNQQQQQRAAEGAGEVLGDSADRIAGSFSALPTATNSGSNDDDDDDDDDDDVIQFPSGSTAVLGPDGRPLPHHGADDAAGEYLRTMVPSAEERRARREELRRELLRKRQSTGFFRELILSASFGELCLHHAGEVLTRAMAIAADITDVRSYEAATNTAKTLMVITALDAHRQRLLECEYEAPASLKLFCEEMVRATCTQS